MKTISDIVKAVFGMLIVTGIEGVFNFGVKLFR